MRRKFVLRAALTVGTALLSLSSVVTAAIIAPGNLVIYRAGTGAAALNTSATAVFLDEYTTSGTLVQSIPVTTTGGSALTAVGNASTEGIISMSQDGQKLVFGGYRHDVGTAPVSGDIRVIGSVGLSGVVDTSVGVTGLAAAVPRSATTVDGTTYYMGTSTNVYYVGSPGPSSTATAIDARNSRQVNLADNILYASNGSTAITGKIQTYGSLPTGATAATPIVTLGTADAVNGFVLLDLDAGVAGADTLYALSTVQAQLQKYTYNGSTWSASGSIGSTASNITAQVSAAGIPTLYFTTATALQSLTDSSGYGGTLIGTVTPLATAAANTGFRGIGTLVVPEPNSLVLFCLACCIAFVRRRTVRG